MRKIFFIAAFVAGIALQAQVSTTRINDIKLGMKLTELEKLTGQKFKLKLNEYSYANAINFLKIEADPAIHEEYKPWMHVLLQNPNIYKICCFLIESKVGFSDMHIGNLMFIGDKMVVSDYGVTDNNANYRIN